MKYIPAFSILAICLILSCKSNKAVVEDTFKGYTTVYNNKLYAIAYETEVNSCFIAGKKRESILDEFEKNQEYSTQTVPRTLTHKNVLNVLNVRFANQSNTKIVVKLSIDRAGIPVMAQFLPETTTKMDYQQRNTVLEAIMGYRYEANPSAPCLETGTLTIMLDQVESLNNQ